MKAIEPIAVEFAEPVLGTHMGRKELGATGVMLPEIGLGTWQYEGGVEPLRTGINLGATFIDTAEAYGTEEVVGEAIKGIRASVFLATKVSPIHFRYGDVIRSCEQSLRRLGTDYIDLYQLHWPNYTVAIEETMAAMEELVGMGKVRFIGVSSFSARETRRAQAALKKNRIVSNQVRYSLVDRSIERGVLQYCAEHRITVIAFSPLAIGLHNMRKFDARDVLGQVAAAANRPPAQVAINWCISHSSVVTIPKANQVGHVRENCASTGWRLDAEQMGLLNRGIAFRSRGPVKNLVRRIIRHSLQSLGRNV